MRPYNCILFVFILTFLTCKSEHKSDKVVSVEAQKNEINISLDNWHAAAAEADFDAYFNLMTSKAVYIGTDATENWQIDAFKTFSKPYFDNGKAWSFEAIERNIYFSDDKKTAWFDELLDTQMKICRGSGIMILEEEQWKIAHYVLSIAIPNVNVNEVITLKKEFDSLLTHKLKSK